jgi:hypothetical protein
MSQLKSVDIPKPCHETWQAMAPVKGGRHCKSCYKTVTDFTVMSNNEIVAYLSTHTNVCGRMRNTQLATINQQFTRPLKRASFWLNYRFAALFAAIMAFTRVEAQTKLTQPAATEQFSRHLLVDTILKDTTDKIRVWGIIRAKEDGLPIPGATVQIKGTNEGVATDKDGHFIMEVNRRKGDVLVIRMIGYTTQEVKIKKYSKEKYQIDLVMAAASMGEVVIVRDPDDD